MGKEKSEGGPGQRRIVSLILPVLTKNTTTYYGLMAVERAIRIKKIEVAFYVLPASAAGTVLANVYNWDVSAGADDALQETADFDLEVANMTAKVAKEIPVQTTTLANVNDIVAGDFIYLKVVSNNNDMTDGSGGVITLEYELVPPE